jgi:hypothetical protein
MVACVADTHAALWFLFGDPRLSTTAKRFFETAASERRRIVLDQPGRGRLSCREEPPPGDVI